MTIGIAAYGASAGEAVCAGVLGAELLGRGAIGGFAVFAILDGDGRFQYRATQEGGITALSLPRDWLEARVAAAISSGPNRPEPLSQFLVGRSGVGLVTGHRLPNSVAPAGKPLNEVALEALASGGSARGGIDAAMEGCAEIDAGLIALTRSGDLAWANSARVARRSDLGEAHRLGRECGFALMHNAIFVAEGPCQRLAEVLAGLVWQRLAGEPATHVLLRLVDPVPLRLAEQDRVHVDEEYRIIGLDTANASLLEAERVGTVAYLCASVWRDGKLIGKAATELFARMQGGVAYPLDQESGRSMVARRCHVAA